MFRIQQWFLDDESGMWIGLRILTVWLLSIIGIKGRTARSNPSNRNSRFHCGNEHMHWSHPKKFSHELKGCNCLWIIIEALKDIEGYTNYAWCRYKKTQCYGWYLDKTKNLSKITPSISLCHTNFSVFILDNNWIP